jgi:hypothetical protein
VECCALIFFENKLKRLGTENGKRIVNNPAVLNQIYAEMAKSPGNKPNQSV